MAFLPERFDVGDEAAMDFLKEYGYAVFKDVATPEELSKGESLLWDYLSQFGVERNDKSTWNWEDPYRKGIVPGLIQCSTNDWPPQGKGIGHSEFLWFCRSLPKIKQIYSAVWGTDELITSFDGCCIHKPWEYNDAWKYTDKTWYHLDQNGIDKPGMQCVQGFLNFFESGPDDGGLCLVSKSQRIFTQIFLQRPQFKGKGDWVMVENDRPLWDKIRKSGLSGDSALLIPTRWHAVYQGVLFARRFCNLGFSSNS